MQMKVQFVHFPLVESSDWWRARSDWSVSILVACGRQCRFQPLSEMGAGDGLNLQGHLVVLGTDPQQDAGAVSVT